jgi:Transposase DNA-binding/Transposase Tn5 dimerisation domain
MSWIETEIAGCGVRDKRLRHRLALLLERLSDKPTASIPAACRSWAETQAAYRFLSNANVEAMDILAGHGRATLERIRREPVVLIVQDTTFLKSVTAVGPHGFGTLRRTAKEEYLRHPSVAFTPERVNLGVLGHHFWQRPDEPVGHLRKRRPLEEKESYRWLLGYERACQVQEQCPETLVINVADRAGDMHEWFRDAANRPEPARAAFISRAKCNRRVADAEQALYLWEALGQSPVQGHLTLSVPRQPGRRARAATLSVHAKAVTFPCARRLGGKFPPVEVQAVYVKEASPPAGEEALEWMLLTNLAVEDFDPARVLVAWYRARWEVELYFRILKQGCKVEDLRLESQERLEKCIAVYLIIAWRIHHITQAVREQPEVACTAIFSDQEWQTIYLLQNQKPPPQKPPPLRTITRMLAQLGGFLARKGDGEPGVETVWRGYMELQRALKALEIAKVVNL